MAPLSGAYAAVCLDLFQPRLRYAFCLSFAGAVVGGLVTLACAYLVRLQRKNEQALQDIYEDDLIASWSQPTPAMHAAVKIVQANFRWTFFDVEWHIVDVQYRQPSTVLVFTI